MYLKSQSLLHPVVAEGNVHHTLFAQPGTADWRDYTLHIDAETGQQRTYEEFRQRVIEGAAALGLSNGLGLRGEKGDVIGIITPSSLEHPVLVHSLIYIATPFAIIPDNLPPAGLENVLKMLNPTHLFVDGGLLPMVLPVMEVIGIPPDRIHTLGDRVKGHASFEDMIKDVQSQDIPLEQPQFVANDMLAYLLFSSGTTGEPKLIMVSHGNIKFWAHHIRETRKAEAQLRQSSSSQPESVVHLSHKPAYHLGGMLSSCLRGLVAPGTCVILRDQSVEAVLKAVTKYKVTAMPVYPILMRNIIHYPHLKDLDLSTLRSTMSSGSYLSPELATEFLAVLPQKVTLSQIYGSTETSGGFLRQRHPFGSPGYIMGSLGELPPGFEARVVREDGSEADFDEPGELYLRGGCIVSGYWKNEKTTQETFVDGWLRTGDQFRVNKNGHFFFGGRVKDMIRISGNLISPVEVEKILLEEPMKLVKDVVVAGVGRHVHAEDVNLRAWIVLSDEGKKYGADATIKALEAWNRAKCVDHQWLGGIEVVDEIPKTPSGKPVRRQLRNKFYARIGVL